MNSTAVRASCWIFRKSRAKRACSTVTAPGMSPTQRCTLQAGYWKDLLVTVERVCVGEREVAAQREAAADRKAGKVRSSALLCNV